jgi:endo-1,4-beta-xylanase
MISRRALLAAGAAAMASGRVRGATAPINLGDAAAASGLLFGASIGQEAFDDRCYADLYRQQTHILTTDVALKFDWLRPTPDRFEFSYADAIVRFAADNGKALRGHTLIWNDRAPDWLKRLSGREVERVFDAHIDRVVERYAGKLFAWDVVNEPFWPMDRQTGGWRNGPWFAAMGPSYVERAFRRVAAIDKTARLTLNEAQCDNDHEWGRSIRPLLVGLVDRLLDAGAPIDTIGLQSHLKPQWPADYAAFADYVADFGKRGLSVSITEFDIDDSALPDDAVARDRAVAAVGAKFLDAVLAVPAVDMVVTWQLSDRYSWYRELSRRAPRPLPFDADLRIKPLGEAMTSAFAAAPQRAARVNAAPNRKPD